MKPLKLYLGFTWIGITKCNKTNYKVLQVDGLKRALRVRAMAFGLQ